MRTAAFILGFTFAFAAAGVTHLTEALLIHLADSAVLEHLLKTCNVLAALDCALEVYLTVVS